MSDQTIERRAIEWLLFGEAGLAAKTMLAHMIGFKPFVVGFPVDIYDFQACLRMMENFPEWADRWTEMAQYGKTWPAVVAALEVMTTIVGKHESHGDEWCRQHGFPCRNAWKSLSDVMTP